MWGSDEDRREFGRIYPLWHGDPAVRNRKAAVQRLTGLADRGYAPAQFALAMAYYDGEGVRRDYQKSFAHMMAAANQQYPAAENMIGSFYGAVSLKHGACEHDPVEAARWFRRAAEHGNAGGMFNFAQDARTGLGTDRDQVEAYVWASLAVHCSSIRFRPAEVLRDQAAADLGQEQKQAADARIAELRAGLPHPWSEPLGYWRTLAPRDGV
jgi:hypothetical protein